VRTRTSDGVARPTGERWRALTTNSAPVHDEHSQSGSSASKTVVLTRRRKTEGLVVVTSAQSIVALGKWGILSDASNPKPGKRHRSVLSGVKTPKTKIQTFEYSRSPVPGWVCFCIVCVPRGFLCLSWFLSLGLRLKVGEDGGRRTEGQKRVRKEKK
jgi:hypothetical protein